MKQFTSFWTRPRLGVALLALAFAVGCTQLFLNNFADEGENLASGLLALDGRILYRDIFSHHFPFAHYWTEFVFRLFGSSILAARLSVLLFQITSFALVMRLTRWYISVGLAALTWNLIGHAYFGNMVLYQNFTGASLFVVFAVTFALIRGSVLVSWKQLLAIGVFSTIAMLSNPLTIYSFIIVIGFLAASIGLKRTTGVVLIVGIGLALYLGYLLFTGSFIYFYRDTIIFNSKILSKYIYSNPVRIIDIFITALNALKIQDPRWMNLNLIGSFPEFPYEKIDYRLSTGFLYRLSIILTTLILLAHKQFLSAGFVYLFAATLLVRKDYGFHSSPFVIVSLLIVTLLITGEWRQYKTAEGKQTKTFKSYSYRNYLKSLMSNCEKSAKLIVCFLLIVLMVNGTQSIAGSWKELSYKTKFEGYEKRAEKINNLACGRSDVALAYYPGDPIMYFFTKMPTVSKYFYMYPWVAEVGLSDVISSLNSVTAVVYFERNGKVLHYNNKDYLSKLKKYLDKNYKQVEDFYLSPSLIRECHSN